MTASLPPWGQVRISDLTRNAARKFEPDPILPRARKARSNYPGAPGYRQNRRVRISIAVMNQPIEKHTPMTQQCFFSMKI
jgi:hypothetical protein